MKGPFDLCGQIQVKRRAWRLVVNVSAPNCVIVPRHALGELIFNMPPQIGHGAARHLDKMTWATIFQCANELCA